MNSLQFWYNHGSYMKNLIVSIPYVIVSILITLLVIYLLNGDNGLFHNVVSPKWIFLSWFIYLLILPFIMNLFPDKDKA